MSHTDTPAHPADPLHFSVVKQGQYRVIALSRHEGVHEHDADSLAELNQWLASTTTATGTPVGSPVADPDEAECLQSLLDLYGTVHVRTGMDLDMVFIKRLPAHG